MAKKKEEVEYSVILDTSFMIRLLNESDKLHNNALGYFHYFLEQGIPMYFSTVSIAEYCVKGDFHDLHSKISEFYHLISSMLKKPVALPTPYSLQRQKD